MGVFKIQYLLFVLVRDAIACGALGEKSLRHAGDLKEKCVALCKKSRFSKSATWLLRLTK